MQVNNQCCNLSFTQECIRGFIEKPLKDGDLHTLVEAIFASLQISLSDLRKITKCDEEYNDWKNIYTDFRKERFARTADDWSQECNKISEKILTVVTSYFLKFDKKLNDLLEKSAEREEFVRANTTEKEKIQIVFKIFENLPSSTLPDNPVKARANIERLVDSAKLAVKANQSVALATLIPKSIPSNASPMAPKDETGPKEVSSCIIS